jgi:hypothetical protein
MLRSFQKNILLTTRENNGLIMFFHPPPKFQFSLDRIDQTNLPGNQRNSVCRPKDNH